MVFTDGITPGQEVGHLVVLGLDVPDIPGPLANLDQMGLGQGVMLLGGLALEGVSEGFAICVDHDMSASNFVMEVP